MAEFVVPSARGPVEGTFRVPPSKSLAQRALVLAALSDGPTEIVLEGPASDDVDRLARALRALTGAGEEIDSTIRGGWTAGGLGGETTSHRLDLGMNATGFRFLLAIAGLRPRGARTLVSGRPRLLARPHGPLLRALTRLGAHARRRHSGSVRVIATPWARHHVDVRGDGSSQYTSALLLAAPRAGGLRVRVGPGAVSRGYVALTTGVLGAFGIDVTRDGDAIVVAPGAPSATRFVVEPDTSSAAVWWTAAALTGGRVRVPGLSAATVQPDAALLGILERMGASVGESDQGVTVEGPIEGLEGAGEIDLRDAPDLAPLVAVLGAGASGETRVIHAPHLRWKESDRIASLVAGLKAVGADVTEAADGFSIRGPAPLRPGRIDTAGDHRLAMAFGVLGLVVPGITLSDGAVASKSYPGFLGDLLRAAGITESANPPVPE